MLFFLYILDLTIVIVFWLVNQSINWRGCRVSKIQLQELLQNPISWIISHLFLMIFIGYRSIRKLIINFFLLLKNVWLVLVLNICLIYWIHINLQGIFDPQTRHCFVFHLSRTYLLNDMVNAVSDTNHPFCLMNYLMNWDVLTMQLVSKRNWKHTFSKTEFAWYELTLWSKISYKNWKDNEIGYITFL